MNSTTACVSLGILAGIGAGGALGYFAGRWSTKQRGKERSVESTLDSVLAEIGKLRELLVETRRELEKLQAICSPASRTTQRPLDTESEYQSTYESLGEDEEDFYDLPADTPETNESEIKEPKTELEVILKEADDLGKVTLEKEDVCDQVIAKLSDASEKFPTSPELLWRLARAYFHKSLFHKGREEGEDEKRYLSLGESTALQALLIQEDSWQCHKWYAIVVGASTKFLATSDKIEKGNKYKEHIDRAIELNPTEPNLHFFLGMWYFEVASLSWFERKAATMIYSSVPTATYQDSLDEFVKAETLMPNQWKNNELMIAKCQLRLGQKGEAGVWLTKASNLPTITSDDKAAHTEIEQLLIAEGY